MSPLSASSPRRKPPLRESVTPAEERALQELFDQVPELERVLENLSFSRRAEVEVGDLLAELKDIVRVEIPDFAAFRTQLTQIEADLAGIDPESDLDPLSRARLERRDDPLLRAVLEAGDAEAKVLTLLNHRPIDGVLPFVEEVPFVQGGEVVWRMPYEIALLRKIPWEPVRFEEVLGELAHLVETLPLARKERLRRDLLESIARLRGALERERTNWSLLIRSLEGKIVDWLGDGATPDAGRRRAAYEGYLVRLLEVARDFEAELEVEVSVVSRFQAAAQALTREFLDAPWMHSPWISRRLLRLLLASDFAALQPSQRWQRGGRHDLPELAVRVWREVSSGCFDPLESISRLRRLEGLGLFVHSYAFALLRLEAHPKGRLPPSGVSSD